MNFSRGGVIFFPPTISSIKYFQSAWYLTHASLKILWGEKGDTACTFLGFDSSFCKKESEKMVFKVPSRHARGSGGPGVGVEKFSFLVGGWLYRYAWIMKIYKAVYLQ